MKFERNEVKRLIYKNKYYGINYVLKDDSLTRSGIYDRLYMVLEKFYTTEDETLYLVFKDLLKQGYSLDEVVEIYNVFGDNQLDRDGYGDEIKTLHLFIEGDIRAKDIDRYFLYEGTISIPYLRKLITLKVQETTHKKAGESIIKYNNHITELIEKRVNDFCYNRQLVEKESKESEKRLLSFREKESENECLPF